MGEDPRRWRCLSPMETGSHEKTDMRIRKLMLPRFRNAKEHLIWRCELKVMGVGRLWD